MPMADITSASPAQQDERVSVFYVTHSRNDEAHTATAPRRARKLVICRATIFGQIV